MLHKENFNDTNDYLTAYQNIVLYFIFWKLGERGRSEE